MTTAIDDLLRDCCWAVGESLRTSHGWTIADDGDPATETPKHGNFVNTLMGEVAFMLDGNVLALMMEAKDKELHSQADILDGIVNKWKGE